jgi:hypothetical protein
MSPEAYVEIATTESTHWWFCARRKILGRIIETMESPRDARILEVGLETGGNRHDHMPSNIDLRCLILHHQAIQHACSRDSCCYAD